MCLPQSRVPTCPEASRGVERAMGIEPTAQAWEAIAACSYPIVPTWRPGGFPLFVDACTNCGDDSDPSTNPTDQATTEPAEFVLN